jgi:predicted metal-dependent phosphoesterase TrpH
VIDLHTHTVFSDGTTSPEENARLAVEAGLDGLALTDHDTLAGWERMGAACDAAGLRFVPGLELSAEGEDGRSVHLLGYWADPADEALVAECARLRGERERRARVMVERLRGLGLDVTWERVAEIAAAAPVGRPHLAAALIEAGAARDTQDAFAQWLGEAGPVWEPKRALEPDAAVGLIVGAGGVAVLAHPGSTFGSPDPVEPLLVRLVQAGLAGFEVAHPAHDPATAADWESTAARHGLLGTASSDFHGTRKTVSIGERATPTRVVDALRDRARGGVRW